MPLTIRTHKNDDVVVLEMSGQLTSGEPVLLLRESIRAQMAEGARHFELDIREVSHIDSSGLGVLVTLYTSIRGKGGTVKLTGMTARSKDLLQMTKLLTVFEEGSAVKLEPRGRSPLWMIAIWAVFILAALLLFWIGDVGGH